MVKKSFQSLRERLWLLLVLELLTFSAQLVIWISERTPSTLPLESALQSTSSASSESQSSLSSFDIDALAHAVAGHETCGCTCGIVLPAPKPDGVNNCFGIKDKTTKRPRDYASKEEAFNDFKRLWSNYYGGMPTLEKASRYVGHDGSDWLKDVMRLYNNGYRIPNY